MTYNEKTYFTMKVAKHWHRLSRAVVDAPAVEHSWSDCTGLGTSSSG